MTFCCGVNTINFDETSCLLSIIFRNKEKLIFLVMLNINAYIDNENAFLVKFIICGRLCTIFPNLVKCCSMHCDSNCAAHHFTNEMNFLLIRYRLSSCVIYRLVATVILISLCKGRKYYKKGRAIELEVVSFTLV